MRVLIEGGNNLFIDTVDIFRDVLPALLNPAFAALAASHRMSIADYLCQRGSFKVFRNPLTVKQPDGTEIKLGRKDILSLSRAYRQHLVEEKEMYLTFPGFSTVRSSLLDLIKMDGVKTGRTYTGRIDGFHHLPFQMDIEAAVDSGVDVCIVPVNLAYERVIEDENFQELTRMHEAGVDPQKIYFHDMGYIIRRFCDDKRKVNLSIKFGEPRRVDGRALKGDVLGTKIKFAAHTAAKETFERVMGMQPVFPANIYFSAFDEQLQPHAHARHARADRRRARPPAAPRLGTAAAADRPALRPGLQSPAAVVGRDHQPHLRGLLSTRAPDHLARRRHVRGAQPRRGHAVPQPHRPLLRTRQEIIRCLVFGRRSVLVSRSPAWENRHRAVTPRV